MWGDCRPVSEADTGGQPPRKEGTSPQWGLLPGPWPRCSPHTVTSKKGHILVYEKYHPSFENLVLQLQDF